MINLTKLANKLPFLNQRDVRTSLYSDVNYAPLNQPRNGHRRQFSLSSFGNRRTLYAFASVAIIVLLGLTTYVSKHAGLSKGGGILHDDGGIIPDGQSRDRGGREVFWWEQFPKLTGLFGGRKEVASFDQYQSKQKHAPASGISDRPLLVPIPSGADGQADICYIDEARRIEPPTINAYRGLPQGMSAPLFGSYEELGLAHDFCYDRINRFGPYGYGVSQADGGLGIDAPGDRYGLHDIKTIDYRGVDWGTAQKKCYEKNQATLRSRPRSAFIFRTWDSFDYTQYHIMMLRAIINELSLTSGGEISVHFLIHVQNDSLPIWASDELYEDTLKSSLPSEFEGMGTLWSVAQMRLVYPPPFPTSLINFSGGDVYEAYRSLHFPLQYFASKHPEFDYFWQWEMDIRVTGHYHELLKKVTEWANRQKRDHLWERSSQFYIPALYNNRFDEFSASVIQQTSSSGQTPISGPQLPAEQLLPIPRQSENSDDITDLITFNPLFDPSHTRWAFHDDITGYTESRPPTRAALITASRMSRRLLELMHQETFRHKHTMFPEMYPASITLHYGLKAVHAPVPVYFDRDWPAQHANEIFNNAKLSPASVEAGMDHGNGHFHGEKGSVFGPGEHVFRGSTYYSNANFAGYLWRRWLGNERQQGEIEYETEHGRMCLPMMILHPVKRDA